MLRKQRGITLIGWICLLVPVALVGYSAIRLAPMYMNYSRVARSMSQVASEMSTDDTINLQAVKVSLAKRFDVEGIMYPDLETFIIRRDGTRWVVEITYEETAPLLYNVSLLATFKKSVTIGKGAAAAAQ